MKDEEKGHAEKEVFDELYEELRELVKYIDAFREKCNNLMNAFEKMGISSHDSQHSRSLSSLRLQVLKTVRDFNPNPVNANLIAEKMGNLTSGAY